MELHRKLLRPGGGTTKNTNHTKAERSHGKTRIKHGTNPGFDPCSIRGLGRLTKLPSPVAGEGQGVRAFAYC